VNYLQKHARMDHDSALHKLSSSTCCLTCAEWHSSVLLHAFVAHARIRLCFVFWMDNKVEQVHKSVAISTWYGQRRLVLRIYGDARSDCDVVTLVDMDGLAGVERINAHVKADCVTFLIARMILRISAVVRVACTMRNPIY